MLPEMAIAAYTSLVSLSDLLDNVYDRIEIQYPPLDAQPLDALRDSVDFFLCKVNAHSAIKSEKLRQLWWEIAMVAHEADDIIDAHVVDLLHMEERYTERSSFCEDMEIVNQKLHKIKADLLIAIEEGEDSQEKEEEGENSDAEERVEAHEEEESADIQKEDKVGGDTQGRNFQALKPPEASSSATHASSATSSHAKDDYVVGLDDKVIEIQRQLTNGEANLQIITITGMGGIGKTTLAKTVYDAPFAAQRFDVSLWASVSQNYVREQVLQGLLDSGEKKFFSGLGVSGNHRKSGESLSDLLYKGLFNRRYLVVLDDVWSEEVWEDLKWFFPTQGNGSRILTMTRHSSLASSIRSTLNVRMRFLNIDNSWKLLCQKAFPQGDGPIPELVEVGKNIAKGCKGLPLSIVVIGTMLAASPMTREYWESVAKDVNSFCNLRDDGHCLKVLSLSFNNLPIHLKACFLYTSFYCDHIEVSELFRNWITWGLIRPIQYRSKESVAKEYFRTLVDRNLILINNYYANREICRLGLHDLLRDLCRKELNKTLLPYSPRLCVIDAIAKQKTCVLCGKLCGDKEESSFCRLVVITPSSSQVRPFMCKECPIAYPHIKRLCLVEVMNIVGEYSSQELEHPTTRVQILISKIPNDIKFVSPSFAHLLWRLHTLVIVPSDSRIITPIVLPSEIWRMPQLKDITVFDAILTYPSETDMDGKYFIILKNLYRLEKIRKFRCTPEVVCRIPNLRVLGICDSDDSDSWVHNSLCNLAMFQKLECLRVVMPIFTSSSQNISFPNTLKELVLMHTRIPWEDITIIGSLPNLESLHLMENAFIGSEWNPTEGEFLRLKTLTIQCHYDLLYWKAEATQFTNLETLWLSHLHQELGIPDGIGDTPTLKTIQLECCSEYVIDSAKQIWEEQREVYGNEDLCVLVKDKEGKIYEFGDQR